MKVAIVVGLLVLAVMAGGLVAVAIQRPFHVSVFRYTLFTHCGPPHSIHVGGSWWRLADKSTSISGPNFTDGMMTMTDPDHAMFLTPGTSLHYVRASQLDLRWTCS